MKVIKLKFNKKKNYYHLLNRKRLRNFKSCEMSQNGQKNEVFSTELKILQADFSKILTKHAQI